MPNETPDELQRAARAVAMADLFRTQALLGGGLRAYEDRMAERMAMRFWDLIQDTGASDEDGLAALDAADDWLADLKRAITSRN